jgi:hypothetical protein
MQIQKENLNFLNLFSFCVDNKSRMGDKFCITTKENKIYFLQASKETILIHKSKEALQEPGFTYTFPTQTFASLTRLFPEKTLIFISADSVSDSKGSNYKFDILKYNFKNILDYINILESSLDVEEVHFQDLDKLNQIKNFMGDSGLDVVGCFKDYFIASNKIRVLGAIKTKNNFDKPYYLPKSLVNILNYLKINDINISYYKDQFCYIKYENTYIICPLKQYKLPNILEEKHRGFYDHPLFITIDRNKFLQTLQRIELFTKTNYYDRVYVAFEEEGIYLENRDSLYAKEFFPIKIPSELTHVSLIVSTNSLLNTINLFTDATFNMHILPTKEAVTLTLKGTNKFYIHMLYAQ